MGVISEYLRVTLTAAAPISTPTLTKMVVLGDTPGKSNQVRNQLKFYTGINAVAGDFDPADEEYSVAQTVFGQGSVINPPRDIYIYNGTRSDYRLGTVNTGDQAQNTGLTWTADKYGDFGDRVSFEVVEGVASETTFSVAGVDQTHIIGGGNAAVLFTQTKDVEQIVRLQFVDPQLPNQELSIEVQNQQGLIPSVLNGYRTLQNIFDYTIIFNLATDFTENVTTTGQNIVDAITSPADPAYNSLASQILDAELPSTSDGTSVVADMPVEELIPVRIKIHAITDGAGAIDAKAWQLRDFANQDVQIAPLFLVSDTGVSNGNGSLTIPTAVNEVQAVTDGGATSGDFTLTFKGQETGAIAYDATAATVQTALESLSTIGLGNVLVTDNAGDWDVEFVMALGGEDVELMTMDSTNLVGQTGEGVTQTTAGVSDFSTLDRINNQTASGLELVRMAQAVQNYCELFRLEKPYFWLTTSREDVDGDTKELSDYIATQRAIYITMNKEGETAKEIKTRIDQLVSDRTGFVAHDNFAVRADAAVAGYFKALTQAFTSGGNGAFTLFYGPLNTIPAATWTDSDRAIMFGLSPGAPGAITYMEDFDYAPGSFLIVGSWSTSGDFLDRRWKKDFMQLQMTLTLFFTMRSNVGGIPYDNEGIAILEAAVDSKMAEFTRRRLVGARDVARSKGIYRLNFPKIDSGLIDEIDFNRRVYRCSLQFQEAGVIEQVDLIMESGFFANTF